MVVQRIKKNKFANFPLTFEKYFPACILIFILLILTLSVFFRYVLKQPLVWTDEASKYLFIWLIFTSASYAGRLEQHITIDALQSLFPKKVRNWCQLIGRLIWLSFCIFFTIISAIYTIGIFETGSIAITMPWVKVGFVYVAIPVAKLYCHPDNCY
jgi:C4-dicarboxylate transporter DctQ subunit